MTDEPLQELDIPEGVASAEQAVEVLRAWIADGALHVIFDPETFGPEITEWGRLLSDISHHVAKAVALNGQMSEDEALSAIHEGFERGILTAVEARSGKLKGRTKH